jgi:hypothetical protein
VRTTLLGKATDWHETQKDELVRREALVDLGGEKMHVFLAAKTRDEVAELARIVETLRRTR